MEWGRPMDVGRNEKVIMPFHFCMDEVLMIMAMFPFIGFAFRKVHVWWHTRFNHQCHHVTRCEDHHVVHEDQK